MEKLVVIREDGEVTQEFPLNQRLVSLGRDRSNDVCLSDRSVSRHHASVVKVFAEYFLQDEQSTNGTRLNGLEITKHILKHGDEIDIGKYRLRFHKEEEEERQAQDLDKTLMMPTSRVKEKTLPQTEEVKATAVLAGTKNQAQVRFLSGPDQGEMKPVDRAFFTVGKPGGDLVLINRRHTGFFLLKMGAEVAPSVNGEPVRAGGVKLSDGDRIQLGELDLEFIL
jgi:pSer/pThr/pTyr-binding forkhead associated (FHA) protein